MLDAGSLMRDVLIPLIELDSLDKRINAINESFGQKDIDWSSLGQLAATHHLRPWLYDHLRRLPEGTVPDKVLAAYRSLMDEVRLRQLKNLREFFRLQMALEKEGIPMVPFKGFRMAGAYYGDPVLRESSDLDVLIRTSDVERIIPIMTDMGYVSETDWKKHRYPMAHILRLGPEYNMDLWENGQRIAHVELHWQIAGPPLNIGCYYEEMTPFLTKSEWQGRSYDCFMPEGDLLMAAFHHGGKEDWTRLGHILDIGMILKKFPDADYARAIAWAKERHISRIVLTGIQLAHQLCGVVIPVSIRDQANAPAIRSLAKNRLEKIRRMAVANGRLPFRYNTTLYHLHSRDTLPARIRLGLAYPEHFFWRASLKIRRIFMREA